MRVLIALMMVMSCGLAQADFDPKYNEGVLLSKMEVDDGIYKCAAPVASFMSHVYVDGRNYYTQQITSGTDGEPCITHIVFDKADRDEVVNAEGYLGWGHDVVLTEEYQSVVKETVKDMKSYYDMDGNYVEYTGEDANDPWPVWVFLRENYQP